MELAQLRTFVAILEHGSFSRAADSLELAQSTVSFHVGALEKAVRAKLLDRRRDGARATPAGETLHRYALRVLSTVDEALVRVRDRQDVATGHVRVAASSVPAETILPRHLATLRRLHPEITIAVDVSDSRRATASLLAEDCELAVIGARSGDRRVVATAIGKDEIVLVAAPGVPVTLAATPGNRLRTTPILARRSGSGTDAAVRRLLVGLRPSVVVSGAEAVRRCALAGVGAAFLSRSSIETDLAARRLRVIAYPGTPVSRTLYVAHLRAVTLSAAAKVLLQLLLSERQR